MSNETYLNSTPKGCQTCFFKHDDEFLKRPGYWTCGRSGFFCTTMRSNPPPKRSLRQWLYETFWA